MMAPVSGGAGLVEIEHRLDRMLRDQSSDPAFVQSLKSMLHAWSQAVWTAAEMLGAAIPRSSEMVQGLRLAQQPVFVCGAARSGTSLLRDLLDGHPELVVVPTESGFYALEGALSGLRPDRHLSYLGRYWLERLADPPPFWLLGRSSPGGSPYVSFARDLAGWWQVPDRRADARLSSWPLATLAIACALRLGDGRLPPCARMWVEKTPGSERFLERIWRDFPAARVIQIVRRPEAVLASIKTMRPDRWHRGYSMLHVVRHMAPSYRIAASGERRLPKERYHLVRYEDLTANPDCVMREIAGFLGIEPRASLLQPTVAGRDARSNSSFSGSRPDPDRALDPIERALLALAVARPAAALGYARPPALSSTQHRIVGERAQ